MASWIGASDSQRLHQYTIPAARREISQAPVVFAELRAVIKTQLTERHATAGRGTFRRRMANRRVKGAIRDLRSYQDRIEWSKMIVSKHT